MPQLKFFLPGVLALLLLLPGCASVSSTSVHYFSLTPEVYPPKPKDARIPILVEQPKEKFKPIGRFQWETPHSWSFIRKALEYNARVNGADAVIIKKDDSYSETVLTDVPPRLDMVPYTRYVYVPRGGQCKRNQGYQVVPVTNWFPVLRPGYVAENTTIWNVVDAEMVVFPAKTRPINRQEF